MQPDSPIPIATIATAAANRLARRLVNIRRLRSGFRRAQRSGTLSVDVSTQQSVAGDPGALSRRSGRLWRERHAPAGRHDRALHQLAGVRRHPVDTGAALRPVLRRRLILHHVLCQLGVLRACGCDRRAACKQPKASLQNSAPRRMNVVACAHVLLPRLPARTDPGHRAVAAACQMAHDCGGMWHPVPMHKSGARRHIGRNEPPDMAVAG